MHRFLIAVILLVGMSWAALATESPDAVEAPAPPTVTEAAPVAAAPEGQTITVEPPTPTEMTTDPGFGVKYTKDRVIHLPQDQNKFFVTVIGDPTDAKFKTIQKWFTEVPELAKLKGETHFNSISTTRQDYKERYAKSTPTTPLIRVQSSTGGVIYQVSGANIPMSGQALSRAVNTEFLRRWRERRLDNQNNNNNGNRKVNPDYDDDEGDDNLDEQDDEQGDELRDTVPDTQPPLLLAVSDEAALMLGGIAGALLIGTLVFVQSRKARLNKLR